MNKSSQTRPPKREMEPSRRVPRSRGNIRIAKPIPLSDVDPANLTASRPSNVNSRCPEGATRTESGAPGLTRRLAWPTGLVSL